MTEELDVIKKIDIGSVTQLLRSNNAYGKKYIRIVYTDNTKSNDFLYFKTFTEQKEIFSELSKGLGL